MSIQKYLRNIYLPRSLIIEYRLISIYEFAPVCETLSIKKMLIHKLIIYYLYTKSMTKFIVEVFANLLSESHVDCCHASSIYKPCWISPVKCKYAFPLIELNNPMKEVSIAEICNCTFLMNARYPLYLNS